MKTDWLRAAVWTGIATWTIAVYTLAAYGFTKLVTGQ